MWTITPLLRHTAARYLLGQHFPAPVDLRLVLLIAIPFQPFPPSSPLQN
jgi:hypothetical protein